MNSLTQIHKLLPPLLVLSFVSNLAVLISPLFMMQVLDRVIPSGNTATLLLLGVLALGAFALQGVTEAARDTSLGRLSRWVERTGSRMALSPGRGNGQEVIDKVSGTSDFLSGPAALAALNMPWIPLICGALFLVHPSFLALLMGLIGVAWGIRALTGVLIDADQAAAQRLVQQEQTYLSNAGAFGAKTGMGVIADRLKQRFLSFQGKRHGLLEQSQRAQSIGTSASNLLRNTGQITALALGAYLVTIDQLSAGGMIAASIILAKGFGAVEAVVQQLPRIRSGYADYKWLCAQSPEAATQSVDIDTLSGALRIEGMVVPRGGGAPPRLDRVSLRLEPGECLAIVGSSGSGKTTLLNAMSGVDPAPIGSVFLDQSELRSLSAENLYRATGYLPQRAELVAGTIAENISGFDPEAQDEGILTAAKTAGVHGLISALPDAYATDLSRDMHLLSLGQRQRVALARALYSAPKYLFLDEPNALLDAEGEKALGQILFRLKEQGTTIVMILHRSGIIGLADHVLRLERGRMVDFGPRAEVLGRLGMGGRRMELPVLESSIDDLRTWVASQFTRQSDAAFARKAQSIASELFYLACQSEPRNTPRMASFLFSFVDDTHCEISMVEDTPNEIETMVAQVRAKMDDKDTFLSDLSQDEAAVATISRLSERFQVRKTDETTRFTVALSNGPVPPTGAAERLN